MVLLDVLDLALLATLQCDGCAMHQQPSEQVHLSANQVGWRLARLESEGAIEGYRMVFSPTELGLGVTVFASVKLVYHDDATVERFHEEISLLDTVQECYSVAGDADYMLRVVVPDLPALSEFVIHKLMRVLGVDNMRSNIVLTALKRDGTLPLSHLGR